jgi:hypothetical protein
LAKWTISDLKINKITIEGLNKDLVRVNKQNNNLRDEIRLSKVCPLNFLDQLPDNIDEIKKE